MGGNAFQNLPLNAFPRLPPPLYQLLKARWLSRLEPLYEHVAVPAEAPEKKDHGDLDFIVSGPKFIGIGDEARIVTHDDVKSALEAVHAILLEANRTSNFAVPITSEWVAHGGILGEDIQDNEIYCQVDVHVCADEGEWDRIVFFHGFGDLGMILGLIARNCGFGLGTKGLKVPTQPPNPPFHLSSSFSSILPFFGLSMDTWREGFTTQQAVFKWAASSRFFDHRILENKKNRKVAAKREMYNNFCAWAQGQPRDGSKPEWTPETVIAEALVYFNKKSEYDVLMEEYARMASTHKTKRKAKSLFNGTLVKEWTGLHHLDVKKVMDRTREKMGGESAIAGIGMEEIRKVVQQVTEELGFVVTDGVDELTEGMSQIDVKDSSTATK